MYEECERLQIDIASNLYFLLPRFLFLYLIHFLYVCVFCSSEKLCCFRISIRTRHFNFSFWNFFVTLLLHVNHCWHQKFMNQNYFFLEVIFLQHRNEIKLKLIDWILMCLIVLEDFPTSSEKFSNLIFPSLSYEKFCLIS